jgi:hypothetical protein
MPASRPQLKQRAADLRIDLRLVDIGGLEDLPMLRRLARHDIRERALAARKGRLHALCLVRTPATVATWG